MDPEKLLIQFKTGIPIAHQVRVGGERSPKSWLWIKAVDAFLDEHVKKLRAGDTYDDYAKTLGGKMRLDPTKRHSRVPELSSFDARLVTTITREEIAECVATVCKRAHRQGEHLKSVLSSMWTFLGDDSRRKETSVEPNLLLRLKTPERPTPPVVRTDAEVLPLFRNDAEDLRRDIPSPLAMGRAVAIARSGALREVPASAVLLLAGSLQRRRAVIGSHRGDFHRMEEGQEADIVWSIPPFMRKRSDSRRSDLHHNVMLVGETTKVIWRLHELAGKSSYFFPVRAPEGKKTKNHYADPSLINHALQYMPEVDMSCHAWRRGFASHGRRALGLTLSDVKLILDHAEDAPAGDVTAGSYALDPLLGRKREIMIAWSTWLETQVRGAMEADPGLRDVEALRDSIYLARYGKDRFVRRKARLAPLAAAE